jgi:hypothetical protein
MGNQFSMEGFTIEKKADATYKIVSAGAISCFFFFFTSSSVLSSLSSTLLSEYHRQGYS